MISKCTGRILREKYLPSISVSHKNRYEIKLSNLKIFEEMPQSHTVFVILELTKIKKIKERLKIA